MFFEDADAPEFAGAMVGRPEPVLRSFKILACCRGAKFAARVFSFASIAGTEKPIWAEDRIAGLEYVPAAGSEPTFPSESASWLATTRVVGGLLPDGRNSDANDFMRGAGFADSFAFAVASTGSVGFGFCCFGSVWTSVSTVSPAEGAVGSRWGAEEVLVLELRGEPGVGTSVTEVAGVVEEPVVDCDGSPSLSAFMVGEDVAGLRGPKNCLGGADWVVSWGPTYRPVVDADGRFFLVLFGTSPEDLYGFKERSRGGKDMAACRISAGGDEREEMNKETEAMPERTAITG